jgi:hypothetical protein
MRATSALDLSLDEVVAAAGQTGRNSAETLLKLREGLASFSEPQQLAMLRAMDAADESWDETAVLADAQNRITALNKHMGAIDAEASRQVHDILTAAESKNQANEELIADLDAQIAGMVKRREAAEHDKAQAIINARKDAKAKTLGTKSLSSPNKGSSLPTAH